jgi:ADP-ribose pyrophosphatase YjhB (NUDIX family)
MAEISQRPAVTVATIVERDGRFLLVQEQTRQGLRLNQPAGHLESGESISSGAARETLEETGWRVTPTHLVGIYTWAGADNVTFVRFAFAAAAEVHDPVRPLDDGIVRALWMTYEELVARSAEHRSPLVLRCVEDYRAGRSWPAAVITEV